MSLSLLSYNDECLNLYAIHNLPNCNSLIGGVMVSIEFSNLLGKILNVRPLPTSRIK
jgi:hypothetical protein